MTRLTICRMVCAVLNLTLWPAAVAAVIAGIGTQAQISLLVGAAVAASIGGLLAVLLPGQSLQWRRGFDAGIAAYEKAMTGEPETYATVTPLRRAAGDDG